MGAMTRLLASLSLLLVLAGCDAFAPQDLKPGVTTDLEVRDRLGRPALEWRNDDGSVTWEYPKGPQGTTTYMVTIGPDHLLRAVEQVLTEANYARIEKGMDGDQVRRILGKPAQISTFPRKPETVWDWHIAGSLPNEETHFHVHFGPDGRVTGTSQRVEPRG